MSRVPANAFIGKRCAITWMERPLPEYQSAVARQTTRLVPIYGVSVLPKADTAPSDKTAGVAPSP